MARNEAKIEWLRAVYEGKETLFGAFSDKLSKTNKVDAWKSMHAKAQAMALVPNNKDFTYTRDTFWQNLRKNAMKKRDNSRATGTGTTKFTKVDEMVYDIIGKESPTLVGLPVLESGELQTNPPTAEIPPNLPEISATKSKPAPSSSQRKKQNRHDYEGSKEKKMKLMITLLEKENYLKELKIKKLEKELNLPPRNICREIEVRENEVIVTNDDQEILEIEYLDDSE